MTARSRRRPLRFLSNEALGIEWLGQTVASLCWIASVFVYGLEGAGDYLQLSAASAWFLANMAALLSASRDDQSETTARACSP